MKFFYDIVVKVDIFEREEIRFGKEIDFDWEYDIIELCENIFVIGGVIEVSESEFFLVVGVFNCVERIWWEIVFLLVKIMVCYVMEVIVIFVFVVVGGFGGWKVFNMV